MKQTKKRNSLDDAIILFDRPKPKQKEVTVEQYRKMALKAELEEDFQNKVIELLQRNRWKVAHFRPAQTEKGWRTPVGADGKGFPDILAIHYERGLMLVAELKREGKELTPEQRAWLEHFEKLRLMMPPYSGYVELWHPSDWERIVKIAKGG